MKELWQKKTTRIGIAVIILAVAIGIISINARSAQRQREYDGHVEAAEKYLTELDYEQAIAEYTLALEIEPNNEEVLNALEQTYLDYAQSLADAGDYEKAVSVLEEGFAQTGRESLREKLMEIARGVFAKIDSSKQTGHQHISDTRLEEPINWTIQIMELYGDELDNEKLAKLYFYIGEDELSLKKWREYWEYSVEKYTWNSYKVENELYVGSNEQDGLRLEWVNNQNGLCNKITEIFMEDGSMTESVREYGEKGRCEKSYEISEYNTHLGAENLSVRGVVNGGTKEYLSARRQEHRYEYDSSGRVIFEERTGGEYYEDGHTVENISQSTYTYHDENNFTIEYVSEHFEDGTRIGVFGYSIDYEIINEYGEYTQVGDEYESWRQDFFEES